MNTVKLYFLTSAFLIAAADPALAVAFLCFAVGIIPAIGSMGVIPGYVYVLKAGKYYKIGIANDIDRRIQQLQTGSSSKISLVHAIPSWRPFALESTLHEKYNKKQVRGEWYALSSYDVRKLKEL